MCGRFTYSRNREETLELFGVEVDAPLLHLLGRYNIAPTRNVLAVGQSKAGARKAAGLLYVSKGARVLAHGLDGQKRY
ncbi:MAG: hypothetical protein ABW208_18065 [Pyrinomonadaceae bacterium]